MIKRETQNKTNNVLMFIFTMKYQHVHTLEMNIFLQAMISSLYNMIKDSKTIHLQFNISDTFFYIHMNPLTSLFVTFFSRKVLPEFLPLHFCIFQYLKLMVRPSTMEQLLHSC